MKGFLRAFWSSVRFHAFGLFVLMLMTSALEGVSILLLIPLLSLAGIDFGGAKQGSFWMQMHVHLSLTDVLMVYCLVLLGFGVLQYLKSQYSTWVRLRFSQGLCNQLYGALVYAKWRTIAEQKPSHISHLLTTEIMRVSSSAYLLLQMASALSLLVVYGTLALCLAWQVTALLLGISGVIVLSLRVFNQRSKRSGEAWFWDMRGFYQKVQNQLDSLKLAKSFGMEAVHQEALVQMNQTLSRHQMEMSRSRGLTQLVYQGVTVILISLVFYLALTVFHTPSEHLLLLLILCARLSPRISQLHTQYQQMLNVMPSFKALQEALSEAILAQEPQGEASKILFAHSVSLQHASLRYPGQKLDQTSDSASGYTRGLHQVDLKIGKGQMVALVGKSGAGKSTLADVLSGILELDSGDLCVDDHVLSLPHKIAWRKQVGYVTQAPFLLNDTVANNLRLADPEASDQALWAVLERAKADQFVKNLPQGLETEVGGQGAQISGGEAQRLALARVLLREPELLILDEATSHLDAYHESAIQAAMESLRGQVTVLVIAHRLSTVKNADWIFVLDQGALVQSGTWKDLIAQPGAFQALMKSGVETL